MPIRGLVGVPRWYECCRGIVCLVLSKSILPYPRHHPTCVHPPTSATLPHPPSPGATRHHASFCRRGAWAFCIRRAENLLAGGTNRHASISLTSAPLLLPPCCRAGENPCFSRPQGAWAILHPSGRELARRPSNLVWADLVISAARGLPAARWRQSMRAGVMPMLSCPHRSARWMTCLGHRRQVLCRPLGSTAMSALAVPVSFPSSAVRLVLRRRRSIQRRSSPLKGPRGDNCTTGSAAAISRPQLSRESAESGARR